MLIILTTILGVIAIKILGIRILGIIWRIIYPYVLARQKNLETLAGKGNWALVTGCTDGIGRAYAEELAQKGISLVLVSRSPEKLAQMEAEFRRRFAKPDYMIIAFDFGETSVEEYRRKLMNRIKHLDIGILVNNVGAMHDYPQRFHDAEGGMEKMAQIMSVNIFPVTLLSAFVLDQMVKRGNGIIVNISSVAGYAPMYYTAIYSATKAYVNWLSESLRQEYAPQKEIIIQTIYPGPVITKMSRMVSEGKSPSFFMPSAQQFARSAIKTIGNISETTGCMGHQIQFELFMKLFPDFLRNYLIKKRLNGVRENWLKKAPIDE